ncbi:MAG: choice-of-anchor D domain-containing protein, partial [Candidatus Thiodiazotropha sp.]
MFHSMCAFMTTRLSFISLLLIPVNAFATLTLSANSIDFGNVDVGTTSTARIVTLTNTDPNLGVSLSSITSSGDFSNTTNCPATLGPGASCNVNVRFSPSASGSRTGLLSIAGDDPSLDPPPPSPPSLPPAARVFNSSVSLSGVGLSGELSTPTTNIDFGAVSVNAQSQAISVALTNSGNASLSITEITVTAPFEQTNDCPSSLSASEQCTIQVNVTPSVSGDTSGLLQINGTTQTGTIQEAIPLAVTGVDVVATITPSELSFPQTETGATSESLTVTVENSNDVPLAINGITIEGDFSQTNDCGTEVAAAASCEIQVVFAPQSEGAAAGALNIDTASGVTRVVLSGMAEAVAPADIS